MTYTAQQLRAAFVKACISEHARGVKSVGDEDRITAYFRGIGWGWAIDEHCPGGVYSDAVRRRLGLAGPLNWCGIGPAYVLRHLVGNFILRRQCVPVRLRRDIAQSILPSTARVYYRDRWGNVDAAPFEEVGVAGMVPGDLVTVQTSAGRRFGDHFVIPIKEPKNGLVETVEFNALGTLGDGSHGRGVVRRERRLDDVRKVWRMDVDHFEFGD